MNDYENIKWVSDPNTVPTIPHEPARFLNVDREIVQLKSKLNMAIREIKRYQDERKALVFALNDARTTIARLEHLLSGKGEP